MEQIRTLRNLKLIDYRSICEVKTFEDFDNRSTKKNHLYSIEQPEKITVIPPFNAPVEKDFIPASFTTNEFYLASVNYA